MTFRLLGLPEELRLELEQNSPGLTTEAALMIIETSVQQAAEAAAQETSQAIREIQTLIGPHGAISSLQAGGVRIGRGGIGVYLDGVLKTTIDDEGNLFVGSNIDLPASTTFSAFVVNQSYNNEEMGEGDLLVGDNSEGVGNVKYDASEGQLQFRFGTDVTAYMDTDGTLKFLAGEIGGWVIGPTSLKDASGTVGMSSAVTGDDDVRFWAGHATPDAAPFYVTESGELVALNATIQGNINATSGGIGGWTIDANRLYSFVTDYGIELNAANQIIKVGNVLGAGGIYTEIDGKNQRIRSSNFVSGQTGSNWDTATGNIEVNNIVARGELKTFILTSSNQMVIAGNEAITKDGGKLGADVSSVATTVNFGKSLTVGDWIKIQGPDSAGSNNLEWMLIGSLVSGTTYNVTRNVDGSGANGWLKDTPFAVIGHSGDSRIELVAGASASIQLITQGAAWNTQTVQASMSTVAGAITAGAGSVKIDANGITTDNNYPGVSFLATNPLKTAFLKMTSTDDFAIRNSVAGKKISLTIELADASTPAVQWSEDGNNANVSLFTVNASPTSPTRLTIGGIAAANVGIDLWANQDGKETVFNDNSYDIDFRVEGSTEANMLFIDAGNNRVGIGTNVPAAAFSAEGGVIFNDFGADVDFRVEGDTDSNLFIVDAGLDAIGVGGAAESGYKAKVTGAMKVTDGFTWDGWDKRAETWTRTGNHTFTVSGDLTTIFRKGAKIRYKDGGSYEYGVVGSSSHSSGTTTVNLITNTDYGMAAATITDRYISYINNPEGFPEWFTYTPTITCSGSMTWTTTTTIYTKWRPAGGQEIEVTIFLIGTTGGTASNTIYSTVPIAIASPMTSGKIGVTQINDGGARTVVGSGYVDTTNGINMYKANDANFALAASRVIIFDGSYPF